MLVTINILVALIVIGGSFGFLLKKNDNLLSSHEGTWINMTQAWNSEKKCESPTGIEPNDLLNTGRALYPALYLYLC